MLLLSPKSGSGGGWEPGELVTLKASSSLEDFGFVVGVNDKYVVNSFADTEGIPIAAGVDVYISHGDSSEGTIQIGSAAPVALVPATLGDYQYLKGTIPADTPADTVVIVDGTF